MEKSKLDFQTNKICPFKYSALIIAPKCGDRYPNSLRLCDGEYCQIWDETRNTCGLNTSSFVRYNKEEEENFVEKE